MLFFIARDENISHTHAGHHADRYSDHDKDKNEETDAAVHSFLFKFLEKLTFAIDTANLGAIVSAVSIVSLIEGRICHHVSVTDLSSTSTFVTAASSPLASPSAHTGAIFKLALHCYVVGMSSRNNNERLARLVRGNHHSCGHRRKAWLWRRLHHHHRLLHARLNVLRLHHVRLLRRDTWLSSCWSGKLVSLVALSDTILVYQLTCVRILAHHYRFSNQWLSLC